MCSTNALSSFHSGVSKLRDEAACIDSKNSISAPMTPKPTKSDVHGYT